MKDAYKVKIKLKPDNNFELHFNNQELAEHFITSIKLILNEEGNKQIEFTTEIIQIFENTSDLTEILIQFANSN